MSDRDSHRHTETSLLEAHPPTERQTRRRRGPRHLTGAPGRERRDLGPVHDRHNRRWCWILFPFLFFFFLVCCLTPAPSLPLCLVLSLFAGSLPSFLSSPKKNNCFAPVSALQMASGAYLFQHNLQLRGRKSNTY